MSMGYCEYKRLRAGLIPPASLELDRLQACGCAEVTVSTALSRRLG